MTSPSTDPHSDNAAPSTPPPRKPRSRLRKTAVALAVFAACFGVLAVASWVIFNGIQNRRWESFAAAERARGQRLNFKEMLPALPPASSNFAMTPLLAPLFQFDPAKKDNFKNGSPERSDLIGGKHFVTTPPSPKGGKGGRAPSAGNWRLGHRTNLAAWQDYYLAQGLLPASDKPGKAGVDILAALKPGAEEYQELIDASQRPEAQFPVHYETPDPAMILLPHLALLRQINDYGVLSGIAELSERKPELAMQRARVSFKCLQALSADPLLISGLVRIAVWNRLAQLIWEGAAEGLWTAEQLEELQKQTQAIAFIQHQARLLEGERAFAVNMYDRWCLSPGALADEMQNLGRNASPSPASRIMDILRPTGFIRMNERLHCEVIARHAEAVRAIEATPGKYQIFDPEAFNQGTTEIMGPLRPWNFIARSLLPAVERSVTRGLVAEAGRNVVWVGLALERYRTARGAYPPNLDALVPDWIPYLPQDVFAQAPLRYERDKKGGFRLYSVGMNGQDDGGEWPSSERDLEGQSSKSPQGSSKKSGGSDDLIWRYTSE